MNEKIVLYGIIGISAGMIEFAIFFFLTQNFLSNVYLANTYALCISIFYSFNMNNYFNFKKKDKYIRRAIKFYIVCGIGILISNFLIYSLTMYFTLYFSKIISMLLVILFQFSMIFFWTFRDYKKS